MRKTLFFIIFLFSIPASADKLILKTGEILLGKIWVSDESFLWVEGPNGIYRVARQTVAKVEPNELTGKKLRLALSDGSEVKGRFWAWNSEYLELGSETGKDLVRYPWNLVNRCEFFEDSE
ncbi:hypothetical protein [Leptospira ilyithenensis]|uniref:Uncharacterized protein n=1 Tax=Leptospira ilyithenensis TaxID=2484901 RepID=A0A4R9LNL7_9LEPT|nr:hypothetical protein [Leptospira ilyithenensis]TGN07062.1 hypothetical protein EHS11_18245 [Leptospira ilyithenensis]